MAKSLAGKVCIVTGASRGIGKGIALQLGTAGATVYITGRTLKKKDDDPVGGSLEETADEVKARGGKCIPIQCDHSKDEDIKNLFDRVSQEQNGQLDVLVNNAYSGVQILAENFGTPFWELDADFWDEINNVGLRNHYICGVFAARLMVPRKQGLIINVSSAGGLSYLFNVAYGIGKEACDRMAVDCAKELRKHNVAFVSLWPGVVQTEMINHFLKSKTYENNREVILMKKAIENGETPEYTGICVARLAADPDIMKKTGRILIAADLGREYGFTDVTGQQTHSLRELGYILSFLTGNAIFLKWIPSFLRIPYWILSLQGNKF